jgi:ribosomal protein S21
MGVRIIVAEREPIGLVLKRFNKLLERHGITWEMRRRKDFAKATQARRAKRFQKRFKARKATLLAQRAGEQPVASLAPGNRNVLETNGKAITRFSPGLIPLVMRTSPRGPATGGRPR